MGGTRPPAKSWRRCTNAGKSWGYWRSRRRTGAGTGGTPGGACASWRGSTKPATCSWSRSTTWRRRWLKRTCSWSSRGTRGCRCTRCSSIPGRARCAPRRRRWRTCWSGRTGAAGGAGSCGTPAQRRRRRTTSRRRWSSWRARASGGTRCSGRPTCVRTACPIP